ncbi:MAG TPA: DinB family protein [Pyrinomonadaceae bacterium]|nr:DinB family protein [Pyrinomonadaceae bacterium]
MIYNSVDEIYGVLDAARARLMASVEGLGEEGARFRPAPDRWSVADILEHLAAAEASSLRLFDKLLQKAEAGGRARSAGDPFAPVTIAEHSERSRREKYQSPEAIRPKGEASVADSLASLRASLEALHALRPRIERAECSEVSFPHAAFGPLNLYQWLLFTAAHEDRHRAQIEALRGEMKA